MPGKEREGPECEQVINDPMITELERRGIVHEILKVKHAIEEIVQI